MLHWNRTSLFSLTRRGIHDLGSIVTDIGPCQHSLSINLYIKSHLNLQDNVLNCDALCAVFFIGICRATHLASWLKHLNGTRTHAHALKQALKHERTHARMHTTDSFMILIFLRCYPWLCVLALSHHMILGYISHHDKLPQAGVVDCMLNGLEIYSHMSERSSFVFGNLRAFVDAVSTLQVREHCLSLIY